MGRCQWAGARPTRLSRRRKRFGEDDMVAVHSHVVLEPGDLGVATLYLFRFEDGEIVELWNFGQPIQADSSNSDGPF
jgi:predicted SnoaL-like aldol condensation-catalyzing enzyme